MVEKLLDKLYDIVCYMSTEDPSFVSEEKPKGTWMRFTFKELTWWEYDNIVKDAFTRTHDTFEWTINAFKKKRLLLKHALRKIEEWDGKILESFTENCYDMLPDIYGELLSDYYDNMATISVQEISELESQVRSYMDPGEINKIKPPYDRMIVELDIARRLGGYSREDILSMSKKDMDKIFVLGRLGLKIPFQQTMADDFALNNMQDNELINLSKELVNLSPPDFGNFNNGIMGIE